MPFRDRFDCLWCGSSWSVRGPDDLEGWAQLCPDCLGKAGDNQFLRFRLRTALAERAGGSTEAGSAAASAGGPSASVSAGGPSTPASAAGSAAPTSAPAAADDLVAWYGARAAEYDDWYLRRGRYDRGAIANTAWQADLDAAGLWLDSLPISGEIVELAAGTGWWSPLLAEKGELSAYDASGAALDRARDRLLAHGLRAHLHVRDAWAAPDRQVDAVFAGFWLSHVPRERLGEFLALVRRWLRPGGIFAFVDARADRESGARDEPAPVGDRSVRRLNDGREFTIVEVHREPGELSEALLAAGFQAAQVGATSRFFLLGRATA